MNKKSIRCANMNHGRLNAPVRNCSMCGEVVNKSIPAACDGSKHAARKKSRDSFCCDCGKSLTT